MLMPLHHPSVHKAIVPFIQAGFALHWLHPREKAPIGADWQKKPVASLETLRVTYREGNNVGVRLGEFSRVAGGYLHVIDLDIRNAALSTRAWAALETLFPGVDLRSFPTVISGSGGESRHIYFIAPAPFKSKTLAKSEGYQMVFDAKKGREVKKRDWEIALFGAPKQVAMPPSIHPDTGLPYCWERAFDFTGLLLGDGPFVSAELIEAAGAIADEGDDGSANTERLGLTHDQAKDILAKLPIATWCEDRDGWTNVGMALKHEFGDDGYELWCEFSRQSAKFDTKTQKTVWKSFRGRTAKPIRMATLKAAAAAAHLMAQFDEEEDGGDETPAPTPSGGGNLPKTGGAETTDPFDLIGVEESHLTGDSEGDDEAEADPFDLLGTVASATAPSALDWMSLLDIDTDKGAIRGTLHNVELIIKNDPRLIGVPQINEFTQETVQRTQPGTKAARRRNPAKETRQLEGRVWDVKDVLNGDLWSDDRDFAIRSILEAPKTQGGYGVKVTDRDLKAAVVLAANQNAFHPVREYLASLTWDGTARLERLFIDYLGAADTAYSREVARIVLIGGVTRIFEPGHKFDTALILEGLQGRRKSTFIKILGRRWFAELDGDFHDPRQMIELMQGAWILEIPELSSFGKADVRSIKAFISRQTDRARLAYARRAGEFPRQCIFIGSTNDQQYLKDDTGGRRFLPMPCEVDAIDTDRLEREIDQIWAEAVSMYRAMRVAQPTGTLPLYLKGEASREAKHLQESRRQETEADALSGLIQAWLDRPLESGSLDEDTNPAGELRVRQETCLLEIWCECLGNDRKSYTGARTAALTLASAMRHVPGWELAGSKVFPAPYGKQKLYVRGGRRARIGAAGIIPER